MSGLSVIIPSRNTANLIPCISAMRAAGEVCRVIWVDDRPGGCWAGEEVDRVKEASGGCNLLVAEGSKPFSFPRNINIGIQAAGNDDVVLLNDDALLQTPGGFTAMQRLAEEHPEYGIIGAVTNVTGQPEQQPQGFGLRRVPHFAFVCVFIPRRTIDLLGGLDERYCLDYGCDDRDYCEAVTRAGLKVGVFDGCFVDHASLTSTYRGEPHTPKSFARNYALLLEKWGTLSC
jgi:GT2 family glycosyltransferase